MTLTRSSTGSRPARPHPSRHPVGAGRHGPIPSEISRGTAPATSSGPWRTSRTPRASTAAPPATTPPGQAGRELARGPPLHRLRPLREPPGPAGAGQRRTRQVGLPGRRPSPNASATAPHGSSSSSRASSRPTWSGRPGRVRTPAAPAPHVEAVVAFSSPGSSAGRQAVPRAFYRALAEGASIRAAVQRPDQVRRRRPWAMRPVRLPSGDLRWWRHGDRSGRDRGRPGRHRWLSRRTCSLPSWRPWTSGSRGVRGRRGPPGPADPRRLQPHRRRREVTGPALDAGRPSRPPAPRPVGTERRARAELDRQRVRARFRPEGTARILAALEERPPVAVRRPPPVVEELVAALAERELEAAATLLDRRSSPIRRSVTPSPTSPATCAAGGTGSCRRAAPDRPLASVCDEDLASRRLARAARDLQLTRARLALDAGSPDRRPPSRGRAPGAPAGRAAGRRARRGPAVPR